MVVESTRGDFEGTTTIRSVSAEGNRLVISFDVRLESRELDLVLSGSGYWRYEYSSPATLQVVLSITTGSNASPTGEVLTASFEGTAILTSGSQTSPSPELPERNEIPDGIYSGEIKVTLTISDGGDITTGTDTLPLTFVIEDGRLLDADGIPFKVGGKYFTDADPLFIIATARSITAAENQIVLRIDLDVEADAGGARGEFSGRQTDTLAFDANSNTIEFVRTQYYGGIDCNGTVVSFQGEALAVLDLG